MRAILGEDDLREGLDALRVADPQLLPVIEAAGPLPLRLMEPGFSGLASIIVSQMISKASAAAIWRRMSEAGPVTAEAFLAHKPEVIATFGLSRAKASTLERLAQAVLADALDLRAVCSRDPAAAMAELTAHQGIGPWTAEVYLMFCGGHPDVFPAGDVALQAAIASAFQLPSRPSPREVAAMAKSWSPWRSVAARLFWAYYSATLRKDAAPLTP